MQVNQTDNLDVQQFTNMMEALGLKQHVNFGSDNHGNTFDLIFMDTI